MRQILTFLLAVLPLPVLAEACVVHSQGQGVAVQVCQQNVSIPKSLFHDGFCQPQLKGQEVKVDYLEQCPGGAFGVCAGARAGNAAYRQDIHYYGVASDARFLQPFCEGQSGGQWRTP
ncbi:MAG TPA: NADH:ubiquinone oxidoreductase [Pseudomonas sp.]|nr:NADH:ubiquinone oxidoreductase [Pseudomonas sp.]